MWQSNQRNIQFSEDIFAKQARKLLFYLTYKLGAYMIYYKKSTFKCYI